MKSAETKATHRLREQPKVYVTTLRHALGRYLPRAAPDPPGPCRFGLRSRGSPSSSGKTRKNAERPAHPRLFSHFPSVTKPLFNKNRLSALAFLHADPPKNDAKPNMQPTMQLWPSGDGARRTWQRGNRKRHAAPFLAIAGWRDRPWALVGAALVRNSHCSILLHNHNEKQNMQPTANHATITSGGDARDREWRRGRTQRAAAGDGKRDRPLFEAVFSSVFVCVFMPNASK